MTLFLGLIFIVLLVWALIQAICGDEPITLTGQAYPTQEGFCPRCGLQISIPLDLEPTCLRCGANLLEETL